MTLLMTGLGLVFAMPGLIVLMVLSAIAIGISASSTPASSHLLGKYAPAKYAPLIFSLKQTAVPVGLLTAGLAGPILTDFYGWRTALLSVVGGCVLFAIVLELMRDEFDDDRDSTRKFQLSDFKGTIGLVLRQGEQRSLALGCFAFVGLQTTFIAYFVIYLTELGFSLIEAGTVFSLATAVAIPGRIFWGWISSSFINPRVMLGLLAIFMFITVSLTGMLSASWAYWLIVVVSASVCATVFSWHGVTLAEAARLAPSSMRGAVTGGVLSFGQFGGLVLPLIYSLCLSITGSYQLGFFVCGVPALAVGVLLLHSTLKFKA